MDRHSSGIERRRNVRVPLGGIDALVHVPGQVQPLAAKCTDLAVGGLTLLCRYVPREGEQFRVEVASPGGQRRFEPLNARVSVRRCHPLGDGLYELGVEIVEILA
ncbi:MAG: PilZ domain-containing protein [Rhodocyclaceae bacterium]|nr:PilZ domain-containing protein [Rhodocyclaceae bacterium]